MSRRNSHFLASLLLVSVGGCGAPSSSDGGARAPGVAPAPPAERPRTVSEVEQRVRKSPPILLVGLDGADWQQIEPLLDRGALPHLARLRGESAWGVLETEVPTLSPLLWTSMFTGVSAVEHGVLDFSRFQPGTGVREPITSDERRVPATWNLETWAGRTVDVLGLWATYPAEAVSGVLVSDRLFGFLNVEDEPPPGAIYPPGRETWARERLAGIWKATGFEAMRDYLPWLGEAEYERHAESERPYEHPISALRRILVETRLYAALAESLLAERVPDLLIVYLQGTDSIGHVFAPYAPPRQDSISEVDFERYREVPERYFREVDGVLGRLLSAADRVGASVVVVSDHGFYWGEGRPDRLSSFANATAARWHRKEGIWLVRAGGVRPGRAPNGVIRQVFPTLLSLAGMPASTIGEGRPLDSLPAPAAPPYDYLRVYRELTARRRAPAPSIASDRAAAEEIAKLEALGYLAGGESGRAPEAVRAAGSTRTAGSYNNEAILLRGERRDSEARAAFEKAVELDPDLASALWNLSDMLYAAAEYERSDRLLVRALARDLPDGMRFVVGRAIGYQRADMLARSLSLLDRALAVRPEEKELWLFRGRYRVDSGNCAGAVSDFERAAALAPGEAAVFASKAFAHLCLDDRPGAITAFRRSLELKPDQPQLRAMLVKLGGA